MNKNTVSGDIIDWQLRQMGASNITFVNSNMYIVDFKLEGGLLVSYVFNITRGDKYFLQRMRPYAMVQGKYANTAEIAEFIEKAMQSAAVILSSLSRFQKKALNLRRHSKTSSSITMWAERRWRAWRRSWTGCWSISGRQRKRQRPSRCPDRSEN